MSKKRGELDVHVVFEADDDEQLERIRDWLTSRIKEAPKGSRIGFIAMAVYDGDNMVGFSTHGQPTPTAQRMIEEVFEMKEAV
jgi:hypothetical protein